MFTTTVLPPTLYPHKRWLVQDHHLHIHNTSHSLCRHRSFHHILVRDDTLDSVRTCLLRCRRDFEVCSQVSRWWWREGWFGLTARLHMDEAVKVDVKVRRTINISMTVCNGYINTRSSFTARLRCPCSRKFSSLRLHKHNTFRSGKINVIDDYAITIGRICAQVLSYELNCPFPVSS